MTLTAASLWGLACVGHTGEGIEDGGLRVENKPSPQPDASGQNTMLSKAVLSSSGDTIPAGALTLADERRAKVRSDRSLVTHWKLHLLMSVVERF